MARDNAVEYSIDQAQRMFGKGVEVIGRAAGIESIFNYGQEIVKQQDEDIRLGQYKPQYTVGLREAYNQGGLDDGIGWLLEKTGENVASGGAALVGGLASALTAPFSVPVAALIGGATLVGSGIMGTGETAEEMEQKTGDYNEAVAIGAGTIIGILDRFGAGKVIPKDELLSMTGKQLIKALGAEGKTDAAKEIGKRIGKSIAFEGATEGVQEGVVMGATGLTGGEYTGLEVADRILEGTLLGSTMGGATTGGIEALRQGPGVVNQIQDIMSGPGPGGLTPQMAMAGAQLSPDRAQMSLIPDVPKTSAEILMSEKAGDETGGGAPVDPVMAENADKLIRDPDDNIAMTDNGRHFSRLALRLQQLPFSAEGLTGRQVLQELGVLGEQDNKMPSNAKKRDYIGSITEVRNVDTGIPSVKTAMKKGLSKEDKDRFIAAKKAGEVPPADLVETISVLDNEGKPVTIKGPAPTFTFNKQVKVPGNFVMDDQGNAKPEFVSSSTPSSNKGGDLYQSGLEDFLYKNLDNKISKDELLGEYKAYRPEIKTRLLLGSEGANAHGTFGGGSLEYLQRIEQLVEGYTTIGAPNTPDRKFDTSYDDFGIVQYTPNQRMLLGRTKFPFPTKKQDEEFQRKNTDSIIRATEGVRSDKGEFIFDDSTDNEPTNDEIDAWLLKNEPSTVAELNSLAQRLGYDDPFGQVLDRKTEGVPNHKYYETEAIQVDGDETGEPVIDPKKGEPTAQSHTRGGVIKDAIDGKFYAQASETQGDMQRVYEKELDKALPEPGAWSFDTSSGNRRTLTPSDMRTLDEAKGATIDSKPEDSLITYEEDKKSLKEAYSKKNYEEDVEVVNYNGHQKAEKELQNLEFVQDRIEGLEEQEYEFTKEFLPKFFKNTNNKIQRNIEAEKNLDDDGFSGDPEFLRNAKARARDAIIANSGEFLFPSSTIKEPTEEQINEYLLKNEPQLIEALDTRFDKIKESEYLRAIRNLKNDFYVAELSSGGDISKYNEMLKNRKALNQSILSIKKDSRFLPSSRYDKTSQQKKFNPVYTFLDGVPSFMPGYAENQLVRDAGGLQGEEPIHTYYGQELQVDPDARNPEPDEPVFGSQPHPLFLSNHMMYGPDTILIPKASHNGKYYPTDSNKRNDFQISLDILANEIRAKGFSDRSTKFTIAEIVQTADFQDTGKDNDTTWKRRKSIKPGIDDKATAQQAQDFAEHTQNIDSFILTALSRNIKPSEIYRMVQNIITKEVLNRQAANIIARKTANELRRKHKNELDQIQFSDSQDPDFVLNAELMRDMLSNKAKDTAERTHKKLMDKYTKELGFVPVFAPEAVDFGASGGSLVDMGDAGNTPFTNSEDRLNSIRTNIAKTINLNMINPSELNLPSDVDSFSAISNFNPNVFEQLAAQKTLQKNTDGLSMQSIKKDQFESARKLAKLRQEVEESKKAFEGFDPDGKELARRLSLMSADLSGVDPQQIKDLIKAINSGDINFRTPAFGESSSADRFSYRNLIHYAMNDIPNPETGEKGLDGIIIPHRLDMYEVPGDRGGTAETFGLNKYEAIPKKVLDEIAKETGATVIYDHPMEYKGKSGKVYPSKRPVTKLIFNKDFKGKAIAQYKKGGIFEKFRKVS